MSKKVLYYILSIISREREYEEEFLHFMEGRDALVGKKSASIDRLTPEQVSLQYSVFNVQIVFS